MQITEIDRSMIRSGEMISKYTTDKKAISLVGSFQDKNSLDDLLYSIACKRLSERQMQKRDNIVLPGGDSIIIVGK